MSVPTRPLRLGFAGTPSFALPALDALHAAGHRILAVFTQADRPAGRGRAPQASPVKRRALELGLAVHEPVSFKSDQAIAQLRELAPDAFVVVAYGLILPRAALEIPRLGCLNVHASLLPRWRGAAPIQRAILAGDAVSGVSIMRMEAGLDTGPVFAVRERAIGPHDTAGTLGEALAALGAELICETLDRLVCGAAVAVPQPEAGTCYAAKIEKAEALVDWRADAASIERRVRAFNPWPVAETRWCGEQLRIWQAELGPGEPGGAEPGTVLGASKAGIDVACGRGVLRIAKLQRPGRKIVDAWGFANAESPVGRRFGAP